MRWLWQGLVHISAKSDTPRGWVIDDSRKFFGSFYGGGGRRWEGWSIYCIIHIVEGKDLYNIWEYGRSYRHVLIFRSVAPLNRSKRLELKMEANFRTFWQQMKGRRNALRELFVPDQEPNHWLGYLWRGWEIAACRVWVAKSNGIKYETPKLSSDSLIIDHL